ERVLLHEGGIAGSGPSTDRERPVPMSIELERERAQRHEVRRIDLRPILRTGELQWSLQLHWKTWILGVDGHERMASLVGTAVFVLEAVLVLRLIGTLVVEIADAVAVAIVRRAAIFGRVLAGGSFGLRTLVDVVVDAVAVRVAGGAPIFLFVGGGHSGHP